jgi:hypothetical protein
MVDPHTQLLRFQAAVHLLGGQRETARLLDASDRTIRALCSGEKALHDGWLRDIAAVLIARADELRVLERVLSPAFADNLTDEQALGPKRGNRRQGGACG